MDHNLQNMLVKSAFHRPTVAAALLIRKKYNTNKMRLHCHIFQESNKSNRDTLSSPVGMFSFTISSQPRPPMMLSTDVPPKHAAVPTLNLVIVGMV